MGSNPGSGTTEAPDITGVSSFIASRVKLWVKVMQADAAVGIAETAIRLIACLCSSASRLTRKLCKAVRLCAA
jgi:hypothetical protein